LYNFYFTKVVEFVTFNYFSQIFSKGMRCELCTPSLRALIGKLNLFQPSSRILRFSRSLDDLRDRRGGTLPTEGASTVLSFWY